MNIFGYIDRVFSYGFAFEFTDKGPKGLLLNKREIIFNTAEGTERLYSSLGYAEAMKTTTAAGIFEFCGMKVVLHKYFYEVNSVTAEARIKMLEEVKRSVII